MRPGTKVGNGVGEGAGVPPGVATCACARAKKATNPTRTHTPSKAILFFISELLLVIRLSPLCRLQFHFRFPNAADSAQFSPPTVSVRKQCGTSDLTAIQEGRDVLAVLTGECQPEKIRPGMPTKRMLSCFPEGGSPYPV
jgi:hypothetical protein